MVTINQNTYSISGFAYFDWVSEIFLFVTCVWSLTKGYNLLMESSHSKFITSNVWTVCPHEKLSCHSQCEKGCFIRGWITVAVSINGDPALMTSPTLQEIHIRAFVLFGVYFGTRYQDFMQWYPSLQLMDSCITQTYSFQSFLTPLLEGHLGKNG